MGNQRGGVISKLFLIPAGVVVIISVFALGYYIGRGQGKETASPEKLPALPDVVSQYLPKKEDFTFYKTLTEKGEKTVSIDLKPKQTPEERVPAKQESAPAPPAEPKPKKQDAAKAPEGKFERPEAPAAKQQAKPQLQVAKKEPAPSKPVPKLRYSIQVGSYPEKDMAEEEVRSMKKRGYAAFLVATDIPEKGKWYRVRVGSFANKQSAEKLAKELKSKEGIDGFITTE
jgi:cell division septation protein DedD